MFLLCFDKSQDFALARVLGSVWAPNLAIQTTEDDQRHPRDWANGIPEAFQGYQSLLGDSSEIPKICLRQPREPSRAFRVCWGGFYTSKTTAKNLFSRLPRLPQHQFLASRLVQWCLCWRQRVSVRDTHNLRPPYKILKSVFVRHESPSAILKIVVYVEKT